jgi:hypothetical protein
MVKAIWNMALKTFVNNDQKDKSFKRLSVGFDDRTIYLKRLGLYLLIKVQNLIKMSFSISKLSPIG